MTSSGPREHTSIVAWNIRNGGGTRSACITDALIATDADVFVLGECQTGTSAPLLAALRDVGWNHVSLVDPPGRSGGVAVVSRLEMAPITMRAMPTSYGFRCQAVDIPSRDLALCGIYGPLQHDPYREFWEALTTDLGLMSQKSVVVIGDFNAGLPIADSPGPRLFSASQLLALTQQGYTDIWRARHGEEAREYTWMGATNPYRLDHAFGTSRVLDRVVSCEYDHSVRERGLSDHSLIQTVLTSAAGI